MADSTLHILDVTPSTTSWSVKVRVEEKMEPHHSSKTSTRYQRLILVDEKGSRVAALINAHANTLLLHNTYVISNAKVDPVKEIFKFVDHPFQWTINTRTAILHMRGEQAITVNAGVSLTPLSQLPALLGTKSLVDIIGVLISKSPPRTVYSRAKPIPVQDFGIVDQELKLMALTLWNELVDNFGSKVVVDSHNMPVVKFTRFTVTTYYGISLGSTTTSGATINPPISAATDLIAWKRKNVEVLRELAATKDYLTRTAPLASVQRIAISSITDLVQSEERCYYIACDKCPSSTTTNVGMNFDYTRCNEVSTAIPRAKLNLTLFDADMSIDALVFGDLAEKIWGLTASECFHQEKLEISNHLLTAYASFGGTVRIYTVKKNKILHHGIEDYQYVVTSFDNENDYTDSVQHPVVLSKCTPVYKGSALTQVLAI